MNQVTRKPVFRVCDQLRLKPACSATASLQDPVHTVKDTIQGYKAMPYALPALKIYYMCCILNHSITL